MLPPLTDEEIRALNRAFGAGAIVATTGATLLIVHGTNLILGALAWAPLFGAGAIMWVEIESAWWRLLDWWYGDDNDSDPNTDA